jgi:hypothetical protein
MRPAADFSFFFFFPFDKPQDIRILRLMAAREKV